MSKAIAVFNLLIILTLTTITLPKSNYKVENHQEKIIDQQPKEQIKPLTATIPTKQITIQKYLEVDLICTFYSNLPDETWGDGTITASGKKISRGYVAANKVLPFGTVIETEEYGKLIVEDRGNPKYFQYINETTYRIDIYVPRQQGESDQRYKARVKAMGVRKIQGKILIKE